MENWKCYTIFFGVGERCSRYFISSNTSEELSPLGGAPCMAAV